MYVYRLVVLRVPYMYTRAEMGNEGRGPVSSHSSFRSQFRVELLDQHGDPVDTMGEEFNTTLVIEYEV